MESQAGLSLMPADRREALLCYHKIVGMPLGSSVLEAINKDKKGPKEDTITQTVNDPTKCHTTYISYICGHRFELLRLIHISPCELRQGSTDVCDNLNSEQAVITSCWKSVECRKLPDKPLQDEPPAVKDATDQPTSAKPTGDKQSTEKPSKSGFDKGDEDWEDLSPAWDKEGTAKSYLGMAKTGSLHEFLLMYGTE